METDLAAAPKWFTDDPFFFLFDNSLITDLMSVFMPLLLKERDTRKLSSVVVERRVGTRKLPVYTPPSYATKPR